ncbi:hypothetical protein [Haloplanus salilacus]|uniref:hypothetical protein n=1 Tax=Haloplanus salilacus TaxID=2949994 RepID=UPI0030CC8051
MDDTDALTRQATRLHDETPHAVRVSVTLSNDTRELLSEIRDDLNDRAGEPILNTNDVVRLALRAGARYHETEADPSDADAPDIRALTAVIHETIENAEKEA